MKSFAKLAAIAGVSLFMGAALAEGTGSAATDTTETMETGADTGTTGTDTGVTGTDTTTGTAGTMQDPQETQTSRTPTAGEQRHPRAQMDDIKGTSQASATQIKDVQSALSSRGYDVEVDGVMGSNTKDALRRFQRDEGITETGELDQATLQALNIEAASDRTPASVPADDTGVVTDPTSPMGTETDTESGMDTGTGVDTETDTGLGTETDSETDTGM